MNTPGPDPEAELPPSLSEVHGSVPIPRHHSFWKRLFAARRARTASGSSCTAGSTVERLRHRVRVPLLVAPVPDGS